MIDSNFTVGQKWERIFWT